MDVAIKWDLLSDVQVAALLYALEENYRTFAESDFPHTGEFQTVANDLWRIACDEYQRRNLHYTMFYVIDFNRIANGGD